MLLTEFEDFSGKMVTLHGSPYVLEGKAIFVHEVFRSAVLTLTPVEKLQTVEQQVRKQMLPGNARASITFRNIIGNSPAVTSCIQTPLGMRPWTVPSWSMGSQEQEKKCSFKAFTMPVNAKKAPLW